MKSVYKGEYMFYLSFSGPDLLETRNRAQERPGVIISEDVWIWWWEWSCSFSCFPWISQHECNHSWLTPQMSFCVCDKWVAGVQMDQPGDRFPNADELTFHSVGGPSMSFALVPQYCRARWRHSVPNSKSASVHCGEGGVKRRGRSGCVLTTMDSHYSNWNPTNPIIEALRTQIPNDRREQRWANYSPEAPKAILSGPPN